MFWRSIVLPAVGAGPFFKFNTLARSWQSRGANAYRLSHPSSIAILQRSGDFADDTSVTASNNCWRTGLAPADRNSFPPLERAQVVELACLKPIAEGLHITHWTSADLARHAVADGIVDSISPSMVRRILQNVDLQPHRTRYWRTARLDPLFKTRTEKVLWCYAQAAHLAQKGIWTVAVDEVPNHQVLERDPIRPAIPGSIEQREFEYTRHGTVNLLLFLILHSGRMESAIEEAKNARHYIEQLREFRRRHHGLKGVFLIQDGDPSHTSGETAAYWAGCHGWWRPRFTPAHASWLNQAEILVNTFGFRYLRRGSWKDRQQFIDHVIASSAEYNRLYAHPFQWTWTNAQMRRWYAEHAL